MDGDGEGTFDPRNFLPLPWPRIRCSRTSINWIYVRSTRSRPRDETVKPRAKFERARNAHVQNFRNFREHENIHGNAFEISILEKPRTRIRELYLSIFLIKCPPFPPNISLTAKTGYSFTIHDVKLELTVSRMMHGEHVVNFLASITARHRRKFRRMMSAPSRERTCCERFACQR